MREKRNLRKIPHCLQAAEDQAHTHASKRGRGGNYAFDLALTGGLGLRSISKTKIFTTQMHTISGQLLVAGLIFCSCDSNPQVPVRIQSTRGNDDRLARRAWDCSQAKLHRADSALASSPRMTRSILQTYFGDDSPRVREQVTRVVRQMKTKSVRSCYTLRIDEDANMPERLQRNLIGQSSGVAGYARKTGPPVIIINRRFLRGNPNGIPSVLLHELSHHAAQTDDIGYYRGGNYKMGSSDVQLDETQLLSNADTYSEFIDQF